MCQTSSTQMKCKPLVVGAAEVTQMGPGGNRRDVNVFLSLPELDSTDIDQTRGPY